MDVDEHNKAPFVSGTWAVKHFSLHCQLLVLLLNCMLVLPFKCIFPLYIYAILYIQQSGSTRLMNDIKGTVSPDIAFYFRVYKLKAVLSVRPLMAYTFVYFVVPWLFWLFPLKNPKTNT
jgi:hypothetical protein